MVDSSGLYPPKNYLDIKIIDIKINVKNLDIEI